MISNATIKDLCLYYNGSIEKWEIVEIAAIFPDYYHVKHLLEEGSWTAYSKELSKYTRRDNNKKLFDIYRHNALDCKTALLKLRARFPKETEESKRLIDLCNYETNFLEPDFKQYESELN